MSLLCRLCRIVIFPVAWSRLSAEHGTPRLLVEMVVNAPVRQVVQVVRVSQVLVVKITVVIQQLQLVVKSSGVGRRHPGRDAVAVSRSMVIPQLQSIDKVVDVPGFTDRALSSGASVVETLVLPHLQIVETTVVIQEGVGMPVAC